MQKYQIVEVLSNLNHAGSKAPSDVVEIAERNGFIPIKIRRVDSKNKNIITKYFRIITSILNCLKMCFLIKKDSLVFIQYTNFLSGKLGRIVICFLRQIKRKNVKIITVIHDLNELRFSELAEKNRLIFDRVAKITDYFIAHNQKMIDYLSSERKIDSKKLYNLKVFDYLYSKTLVDKEIIFEKSVVIAGNLDSSKASYLRELSTVSQVKFELYGVNFNESEIGSENIHYNGVVSPELLPSILSKGFGLVWDGESKKTCTGDYGNYLRFNNPHKLSLYLVSGLPVVVWNESAVSKFVEQENVGFAINSLDELTFKLNQISETDYKNFALNAKRISERLRTGKYLSELLDLICNEYVQMTN